MGGGFGVGDLAGHRRQQPLVASQATGPSALRTRRFGGFGVGLAVQGALCELAGQGAADAVGELFDIDERFGGVEFAVEGESASIQARTARSTPIFTPCDTRS